MTERPKSYKRCLIHSKSADGTIKRGDGDLSRRSSEKSFMARHSKLLLPPNRGPKQIHSLPHQPLSKQSSVK